MSVLCQYHTVLISVALKCESPDFLIFQDCFCYLGPLHIHMNFRASLLIWGVGGASWDFDSDCNKPVDQFGNITVLTILSSNPLT